MYKNSARNAENGFLKFRIILNDRLFLLKSICPRLERISSDCRANKKEREVEIVAGDVS